MSTLSPWFKKGLKILFVLALVFSPILHSSASVKDDWSYSIIFISFLFLFKEDASVIRHKSKRFQSPGASIHKIENGIFSNYIVDTDAAEQIDCDFH